MQQQPLSVRGTVQVMPLDDAYGWHYVELLIPPADLPVLIYVHGERLPTDGEEQEVTKHGAAFLMMPGEVVTVQVGDAFGVYHLALSKLYQLARHGIELAGVEVATECC